MSWPHAGRYGPESFSYPNGSVSSNLTWTLKTIGGVIVECYVDANRSATTPNPATVTNGNVEIYTEPGTYELTVDGGYGPRAFLISVNPDPGDISAPGAAGLLGQAFVLVPIGPTNTLSLVRGGDVRLGIDPPYDDDGTFSWDTWIDPADGLGTRLMHLRTFDSADGLLVGPAPIDVATNLGIDVETTSVRIDPFATSVTQRYLAEQEINGDDGPVKDWAIAITHDGTLNFEWQDTSDDDHGVSFGAPGQFQTCRLVRVRICALDNGDGSAWFFAYQRLDADGAWLAVLPSVVQPGGLTFGTGANANKATIAPNFKTRAGPFSFGFARQVKPGHLIIRKPSTDPIGSPGELLYDIDIADGAGIIGGGSFKSPPETGAECTLGANTFEPGWIINPTEPGTMLADGLAYQTIPAAKVPDIATSSFTLAMRITPQPQTGVTSYAATSVTYATVAGFGFFDLRAFSEGHVFALSDGSSVVGAYPIDLTDGQPSDVIAVIDRVANTLTVYVNGEAFGDPLDITTLGSIASGNDLVFSGGADVATVVHVGTALYPTVLTADQVALHRAFYGWV